MKLSIVIPCYNEAKNIPLLIKSINEVYKPNTEIILVDNGSTDKTPDVLLKELELMNNDSIRSIRVENNIGYGHGIMTGVQEAKGEIIAWTHADLQTDVKDVYNGYDIFKSQSNQEKTFLKGRRKKRPFIDQILTRGMGKISSIMLGKKLNDINAQPKMFHRTFLLLADDAPDDFSLDLYFYCMAVKNKIDIIELPVYFEKRLYGVAKGGGGSSIWNRIKVIKRTLKYILKLSKQRIRSANS
jgi:glycosyltransferase involved in cell wall biosynthesis